MPIISLNKIAHPPKKITVLVLVTISVITLFLLLYFNIFAQVCPVPSDSTPDNPCVNPSTNFTLCPILVSQPACYTGDSPSPTLTWTFTAGPPLFSSVQTAYWVQVDDNDEPIGNFPSPEVNTGEVSLADNFYTVPLGQLQFNTTYYWKLATKDNHSTWSGWTCGDAFTTANSCPPDVPTLIAPPDDTWINYNPTFQAQVSDSDGDNVSADFNVSGYGDGLGNEVSSGSISSWGPVSIPDGTYSWRARAYDEYGVYGNYSGYWTLKKDATPPSASLDQPNGAINQTSFTVTLTESDTLSGVSTGDVDVRINGGSWQDYSNTTSDFTYDGSAGNTYEFRYQVQDNAGNWSGFAYDGSVYLNTPPSASNFNVVKGDYCSAPAHYFSWIYTDPEGDDENQFQFQVDNDSDFGSPEVDNTVTGTWSNGDSNNQTVAIAVSPGPGQIGYNDTYYWRVKVWDVHSADSGWINGSSFTTEKHQYPLVDFNWSPQEPSQEENVLFADQSTVYGGATKSSWLWTFEDGNPASSGAQNPTIQFTTIGDHLVTLGIRDSDGFYCLGSHTVSVQIKLPGWKEILPW